MPGTKSDSPVRNDEIDFRPIFVVLWKQRKLIIFGTLGATLLAAVISFIVPRVYRSEAFYQLTQPKKLISTNEIPTAENPDIIGIPIPIFKNSSTQFSNPNRIQMYAAQEKSFNAKDLSAIKANFRTAAAISRWITPVYAYSKDDTLKFSMGPMKEPNSVIGLNLSYDADSPAKAATYVHFIGYYVRDCLIYVTLYSYIMNGYNTAMSDLYRNENSIIDAQFSLLLNTNKLQDIKEILKKYPESARIDNRQLVSVQDGGSHYLSPITQLVGIESSLADIRQQLAALQRDKEELTIRDEYFSKCNTELKKMGEQGEPLLALLQTVLSEVVKNKDMNQDPIKQVYNDLTRAIQNYRHTFYTGYRFISGPTVPANSIRPRKRTIVMAAFFLSFFLLVVLTFVLHWWQANKKTITQSPAFSSGR